MLDSGQRAAVCDCATRPLDLPEFFRYRLIRCWHINWCSVMFLTVDIGLSVRMHPGVLFQLVYVGCLGDHLCASRRVPVGLIV
jgi:hypothetical protein